MTLTLVAVALGSALGAVCRYLLDRAVGRPPWGVLLVNLLGSFAAGVAAGVVAGPLLTAGFLGGFTTASTLAVDALRLWDEGRRREAGLDVLLHVGAGVVLGALGVGLGRAL